MAVNAFPDGKFMAPVKVGPKGQIVIPAEVREMFGITPGSTLLLLADINEGIALPIAEKSQAIYQEIMAKLGKAGDGT